MRPIPLEVIESWPAPNYVDPVTRGPGLFVVNSVFLTLATAAVGTRLYTRLGIRRWFGPDDALIIFAYLLNIAEAAVIYHGTVHLYWNRHVWDVPWSDAEPSAIYLFAAKIIWGTASAAIRLSLLCFFYRLLNHLHIPCYRWAVHLNLIIVVGIWLSWMFTTVFNCIPIRAYWVFPLISGSCINEPLTLTILSAFNTFSEILIALMPVPIVFGKLDMPPMQKWSIVSLLSLGLLVGVVGVARTYYVWLAFASYDPLWWSTPHWICSEVELDTALICACAPALRPFLSRVYKNWAGDSPSLNAKLAPQTRSMLTDSSFISKANHRFGCEKGSALDSRSLSPPVMPSTKMFDIEGISTEGYGYKVTITASPHSAWPGVDDSRVRLRKKRLGFRARRAHSDHWSGDGGLATPKKGVLGYSSVRGTFSQRGKTTKTEHPQVDMMQIHTTKAVEVRESYHSSKHVPFKGYDYRNPCKRDGSADLSVSPDSARKNTPSLHSRQSSEWSLPIQCPTVDMVSVPLPPRSRSASRERGLSGSPAYNSSQRLSSGSQMQMVRSSPGSAPLNSSHPVVLRHSLSSSRVDLGV